MSDTIAIAAPVQVPVTETKKENKLLNYAFLFVVVLGLTAFNSINKFPAFWIVAKTCDALIVLMSLIFSKKIVIPKALYFYIVFLVITFMTSTFVSIDIDNAISSALTIAQTGVVVGAIIMFYCTTGDIKYLLWAVIINGLILTVLSKFLGDDLSYQGAKVQRLTSVVKNSNDLGRQMIFASVCIYYYWNKTKVTAKVFMCLMLGAFLFNIFQSGSRTALFSFILVTGAWVVLSYKLRVYVRYVIIGFCAVMFVGSYVYDNYLENTVVVQRALNIQEEVDQGGSTGLRLQLYQEASQAFVNNPIFGIGLDNFRIYSPEHLYAHSNYMELLADTGILGFLLFNYIYWIVWKNAGRIRTVNDALLFEQGFQRSAVILMLIIGVARPLIEDFPAWIFFSVPIVLFEKLKMRDQSYAIQK